MQDAFLAPRFPPRLLTLRPSATAAAMSSNIVTALAARTTLSPRRSKWPRQIGRSHGFEVCWESKTRRAWAAQARVAMEKTRETDRRARIGRERVGVSLGAILRSGDGRLERGSLVDAV